MITKPTLPPISGYVEVQLQGIAYYRDIETGILYSSDELPTSPDEQLSIPDEPDVPTSEYIPTVEESTVVMMRAVFAQQVSTMEDDMILQCSGFADTWAPGNHKTGEIYNANDQTWECYQDYDNDVYPGVQPSDPSWYTFNRPLHGKSPETARPFVPVQGSHDMYRAGEYAVWTNGKIYRCKNDTNFNPSDYPRAWEVYQEP